MARRPASDDVDKLRRDVEWALSSTRDPHELGPLLAKLARRAEPRSEAWLLAHRHLAEIAAESSPWKASIFARRVLQVDPGDDAAWALLGLSQSLLGQFRYAEAMYRRAIALSPRDARYLHNLGHLLDVALDRAAEAVPLLAAAHELEPREREIAASYAHALARAGRVAVAHKVLTRALAAGGTREQRRLLRWIDELRETRRARRVARSRR